MQEKRGRKKQDPNQKPQSYYDSIPKRTVEEENKMIQIRIAKINNGK